MKELTDPTNHMDLTNLIAEHSASFDSTDSHSAPAVLPPTGGVREGLLSPSTGEMSEGQRGSGGVSGVGSSSFSAPAVLPPRGGVREGLLLFSTPRHCSNPLASYDGFNITHYCGDNPQHVAACRAELCEQLGIPDDHLVLPHQVHGTRIAEVTNENLADAFEGVDGLITGLPNVCIGVSTADCVPILFYDTRTGAMGAVHAGWRGTVARIGVIALAAMHDAFGTLPNDIECVIGPSIGPNAFEVGNEVYDAFAAAGFPMHQIAFKAPPLEAYAAINNPKAAIHRLPMDLSSMRWHIDLWQANSWQLERAGVPSTSIHVTRICTYTQYDRYFSARRLGIQSGRIFTGIIRKTQMP